MHKLRAIIFILLSCIFLGCNYFKGEKSLARADISLMIKLVKTGIDQHYFDKNKGAELNRKLTQMELQHKFDSVSTDSAAKMITEMLRREAKDKHFNVMSFSSLPTKQEPKNKPAYSSTGISNVKILNNKIGYMKWDLCVAGEEAFTGLRKTLDSLSECEKLIFDISENPGGDGASSAFINQFLYKSKDYQTLLKKKCTGENNWHQSEVIFNYENGPTFFDKPVYIIISDKTFSAAEYFAFTAKEMKRATLLGKTTAGAGNPGNTFSFASPNTDTIFWMFIPNCQIITRDGKSIEGFGVQPDVTLKSSDWLNETLAYIAQKG
ncbi:MAG: hypothetical protein EOO86_02290 [Pedobacter sp.]|nr:MAG: hypothetical protein EOO86_02290 [Pedobacter sp.]